MTTLPLQDLLRTDEDVAAYHRDGFHVAHDVLPAELLDSAARGIVDGRPDDTDPSICPVVWPG